MTLLQAIERVMADLGRQRTVRYGPRLIDIDILFYADLQLESDDLTIPHPRLAERDFVLGPLRDIVPDLGASYLERVGRNTLAQAGPIRSGKSDAHRQSTVDLGRKDLHPRHHQRHAGFVFGRRAG